MKVIFLNSWYAKAGDLYYKFIKEQSDKTDIFCLNEIQPELFSKLESLLPNFNGFYSYGRFDITMGFDYGQAVFINENIKTRELGRIDTFRNVYNDIGFALPFELSILNKRIYLINVHGKARPGHKQDTPARIKQSERIIEFLKDKAAPKIVGGDFNLYPETKSVKLFEEAGYKNLISEFKITDTRGKINHELYKDKNIQYFADYCFVSSEIKVKSFDVPNIEVSDHLPLILDFEI